MFDLEEAMEKNKATERSRSRSRTRGRTAANGTAKDRVDRYRS